MIKRTLNTYFHDIVPYKLNGETVIHKMGVYIYETPFPTQPTEDPLDYSSSKEYYELETELIKILTVDFEGNEERRGFPLCCNPHSNLLKLDKFNLDSFKGAPAMVAKKIMYTHQHIVNNYKDENYVKSISDYVNYTVESFGQMPKDCGEPLFLGSYFHFLGNLIKNSSILPFERKEKLLFILKEIEEPAKNSKTDLNILLGIYQKWLKVFPFEISYFSHLEKRYKKTLPLLSGEVEVNQFTGVVKAKTHSKKSLIETLGQLTRDLLSNVDLPQLRADGAITDIQANKLEFSEASLKTKTAEITSEFSKGELKYVKALKKWLQAHKEYFNEITPLLHPIQPKKQQEENKLTVKEVALKCYYEKIQITRENGKQIAEQYGFKSGDALYNKYNFYTSTANRKGKPTLCTPQKLQNKIKMFENVIESLPEDKRARATDELMILKNIFETEYQ